MEQPAPTPIERVRSWLPSSPWRLAPGLDDLRRYDRRRQLRPDLVAGLTVAAVAVPAGLGIGELAGLSPVAGLYASLLPLAAYCLFGSSRQLIVGPESTLAALTATTVVPLAAGKPELIAPLAAALALAVGAVQIAGGLAQLGFMADFLSKPVLIGYINGVTSAMALIDIRGIARLRHVLGTEVALAIATLLGVLIFDVLGGLLLAIALSVGVYVYRSVRPHDAVLASVSDLDGYRDVAEHPDAASVPGLLVYRFDAPLYFANAAYLTARIQTLVAAAGPKPRWVVFNAEAVTYIDATAVDALRTVRTDLADAGIIFAVARAEAHLRRVFATSGYATELGEDKSSTQYARPSTRTSDGSSHDLPADQHRPPATPRRTAPARHGVDPSRGVHHGLQRPLSGGGARAAGLHRRVLDRPHAGHEP
jgi:SulP family sulfate permease